MYSNTNSILLSVSMLHYSHFIYNFISPVVYVFLNWCYFCFYTNIDRHGHFVDGYLKRMMSKERGKKISFILATMHSILKIKEVFNMYGGQNSSNTLPTIITQMPVKYWDFQWKKYRYFTQCLYLKYHWEFDNEKHVAFWNVLIALTKVWNLHNNSVTTLLFTIPKINHS